MNSEVSKQDMKQLLTLMQRIENFEKLNNMQIWSVNRLVWGLLLLTAGILDFIILKYTSGIIGWITTISWALTLVMGMLITSFQRKNVVVTGKKRKRSFYTRTQHYWITLAFGLVFIFGYTELNHLTFPVIAILMGALLLIDNYLAKRKTSSFAGIVIHYGTPIAFLLTAIINIVGFYVIGEIFEFYQGLIFGAVIGIAFIYGAFLLRGIIDRNKITIVEDVTE
jgi:hypothetical protein